MRWHQILSGLLCLFGFNCSGQVQSKSYDAMLGGLLSHSVPETSVSQAKKMPPETLWLDAREPREFAVSHIPGALPVGFDHPDFTPLREVPKDTPILVYCSVGYRSEKIAEKLQKSGFTQVSNLYGGIFEWVNQGNPVVDQNGPTQNVHAYDKTWGVWLKKGKKVF